MKPKKKIEPARNQCPCCMNRLWMLRAANLNVVGFSCPKCSVPLRVHLVPKQQVLCAVVALVFAVIAYAALPKADPLDFDAVQFHLWRLFFSGLFWFLAMMSPLLFFPWLFGHLKRRHAE